MNTLCGITLGASLALTTVNPWLAILLFAVSAAGIIATQVKQH
jgi:hypothetical protein